MFTYPEKVANVMLQKDYVVESQLNGLYTTFTASFQKMYRELFSTPNPFVEEEIRKSLVNHMEDSLTEFEMIDNLVSHIDDTYSDEDLNKWTVKWFESAKNLNDAVEKYLSIGDDPK